MKTSSCWPRTTVTKAAFSSGGEACRVGHFAARFPALLFSACLLCLLVALSGCEDGTPVNAQRIAAAGQEHKTSVQKSRNQEPDDSGRYVGSATCGQCHQQAHAQWQTSHHAMAMAEPTANSVKANFGAESLACGSRDFVCRKQRQLHHPLGWD